MEPQRSTTHDGGDTNIHESVFKISKVQTLVEVLRCELGRPVRTSAIATEFEPRKCWTPLYYAVYHGREAALAHFLRSGQGPDGIATAPPPLCVAVIAGHLGIVRLLCEAGATIDATCVHSGETALHLAVKAKRSDLLDILLRFNADVNDATLHTHETPLHYATAQLGSSITVATLVRHGANCEALDSQGRSPAEVALQIQDLGTAVGIIRAGGKKPHSFTKEKQLLKDRILQSRNRSSLDRELVAEVFELTCPSDSTALVEVIKTGDANLVNLLLENGSNPNEATASGLYPIFAAFNACSAPVVQTLVDHGADVTLQNPHGPNLLQAALASPLSLDKQAITAVLVSLLSRGADASATYLDGSTILHRAVGRNLDLAQIVPLLLVQGVDINAQDLNGNTALHLATESPSCIAILLNYGADSNVVNNKSNTPLFNAIGIAESDNEPDVEQLVKASNLTTVDPAGLTALHLAAQKGLIKTIRLLLGSRADPATTDAKKRTPLLLAVYNHRWAAVALLANQPGKNSWDENGLTALHHLAMSTPKAPSTWKDIASAATRFCEKGASRSLRDHTGSTPLIQAAKSLPEEGLPLLQILLAQRGSVRSNCVAHEDHDQRNALYYAATLSKVSFVEALLRHGSPFLLNEWRPKQGPLKADSAVAQRTLKTFAEVDWMRRMGRLRRQSNVPKGGSLLPKIMPIRDLDDLLSMGLDPNRLPKATYLESPYWTLLNHIVSSSDFSSEYTHDSLKLLFAFGADPNEMTRRKLLRTDKMRDSQQIFLAVHPLAYILEEHPHVSLELVRLLLENGISTSVASPYYDGRSPLHSGVRANRLDVVEEMLRRETNVECVDAQQRTPLFVAAENGLLKMLEVLLHAKAKAGAEDIEGNAPIHIAAAAGSAQVVSCLLGVGAKASCLNHKGMTPLHCVSDKLPEDVKLEITGILQQAQEVERRNLAPPVKNSRGLARLESPAADKPAVHERKKPLRKVRNAATQHPANTPPTPSTAIVDSVSPQVLAQDTPAPPGMSKQVVNIRFIPPTPPTLQSAVAAQTPPLATTKEDAQKPCPTPRVDSGLDLCEANKEQPLPVLDRKKASFDPHGNPPLEDDELESWLSFSKMLDTL